MRKTFAFAVVFLFVLLAHAGTALAIIDEIGGGSPPVKKELAVIEGDDLIIYVREDWISDVPKGVPAYTALALYRGKLPHYTAIDKEETRFLFSWPLKEKVGRTYRLVSYQQGQWFQKPGADSLIRKSSHPLTGLIVFFGFILPLFVVLLTNLGQKKRREMLLLFLAISLCALVASMLSFFIGGEDVGLIIGFFTGVFTGAIMGWWIAGPSGAFTAFLFVAFAALFSNRLAGEGNGMTDWLKTNQYLLFMAACCLLSYLTTLIVRKISIRMEVAKHKRVMGQP